MEEAIALEEGIDDAEQLASLCDGKLLDLLEPTPQSLIGWTSRRSKRLQAEEFIGGDAEERAERSEEMSRRMIRLALVVGNHSLGDTEFSSESALGQRSFLAELGHTGAE